MRFEDTTGGSGGEYRQIVDDVESVTTGVKNVNLVMEDLKKDGNYIAPPPRSTPFTMMTAM